MSQIILNIQMNGHSFVSIKWTDSFSACAQKFACSCFGKKLTEWVDFYDTKILCAFNVQYTYFFVDHQGFNNECSWRSIYIFCSDVRCCIMRVLSIDSEVNIATFVFKKVLKGLKKCRTLTNKKYLLTMVMMIHYNVTIETQAPLLLSVQFKVISQLTIKFHLLLHSC